MRKRKIYSYREKEKEIIGQSKDSLVGERKRSTRREREREGG